MPAFAEKGTEERRSTRIETASYGPVEVGYSASRELTSPEEVLREGRDFYFYIPETRMRASASDPANSLLAETIFREWLSQSGYEIIDAADFRRMGINAVEGAWVARKSAVEGEPTVLFSFRNGTLLGEESAEHALLKLQLAAFDDLASRGAPVVEPAERQASIWFYPFSRPSLRSSAIRHYRENHPGSDVVPEGDLMVELVYNVPEGVDVSGLSRDELMETALNNFAGFRILDRMDHNREIREIGNQALAFVLDQIFPGQVEHGSAGNRYGLGEDFHVVRLVGSRSLFVFINNSTVIDAFGNVMGTVDVANFNNCQALAAWANLATSGFW